MVARVAVEIAGAVTRGEGSEVGRGCGRTGCGKTTLLRLLERLYDPTEGTVTLGGCDLRKLDPRWLRQRASFVTSVKDTFVSRTIHCHLGCILLKILLLTGLLRGWLGGWGHGA